MTHLAPSLLAGRRILVTGGGTGLGFAMGRMFLDLGAELVICGRRAEVLEQAQRDLSEAHPGKVEIVTCNIREADSVERMMEESFKSRPIDVLVNNAAANFIAQTESLSPRAVDAILGTTLHGALNCTIAAGKRWIDAGTPGVVLSIVSTSTITGRAFTVPSAMAKSGLLAMTRSLAVEWGPRNIRLVAIAPGMFPTPGASSRLNPSTRGQQAEDRVPLGRVGQHEELAQLAAFLVSDAAGYMTGEMVVLDGGAHLRTSGAEDLVDWSDARWAEHRDEAKRR